MAMAEERWHSGNAYEVFMGRWSRQLAREFVLQERALAQHGSWLDIGCGTGALTQAILELTQADSVMSVDPSPSFVGYAREQIQDMRTQFSTADARSLPFAAQTFSHVVSGLVLNFLPENAVQEMRRVCAAGGRVAAYVWDYADKMEWLRYFWDAAVAVDPAAKSFDEGLLFPICNKDNLVSLFYEYVLHRLHTTAIDIPTHFASFDDYWEPFLCGQFPAPQYVASLSDDHRVELRAELQKRLPINPDGSIDLIARAWAVTGRLEWSY
jgi:SAM-dependent methyltransferase